MKRLFIIFLILLGIMFLYSTDVTFRVNMSYQTELGNFDPNSDIVDLAGNFNNWQGSGPMEDVGSGIYQTVVTDLEVGYVCEFKFRINANWDTAEFPGGANRTYTVVEGENTVEVWYNDQEPPVGEPATITFLVNDSVDQTHTAFYLKGSWDENGVYDPMWGGGIEHAEFKDDGTNGDQVAGDHIFTAVVQLYPDGGEHTWEWGVNDENHNWMDGNWQFTVPDTTSQTLTYNVPTMTTQDVTVTFNLDMTYTTPADTISLAGDFNDWTTGINILQNTQGMLYTVSVLFPAGSERYHEFKFVNGQEWESINNRSFIIDDSSPTQVLDTVYFNDIGPDAFIQQDVTVHFSVDMSNVETVSDTVSLAGDFNNWAVGADIMSDDNSDNIYTIEILFPAGSLKHHEYKFVNGQEFESINNRILEIDDSSSDMILDTVYFNDGQQDAEDNQLIKPSVKISAYPNPFIQNASKSQFIKFAVNLKSAQKGIINIYNIKGEKIKTIDAGLLEAGKHIINWNAKKDNLKSGIYLYNFGNSTKKLTFIK